MYVYKMIYDSKSLFVFIIKLQVEPCHLLFQETAWSRNSVYFRHGAVVCGRGVSLTSFTVQQQRSSV